MVSAAGGTRPAVAPGRLPVLGHVPRLVGTGPGRLTYLLSLRDHGDAVIIHLGRTPVYVLNSPALIHGMLLEKARDFKKGLLFERARPFFGNGLLSSDGEFHKRQRRLLQPAFHHANIAAYQERMAELATERFGSWTAGQVVPVDHHMHRMATDVVAHTLFSSHYAHRLAAQIERSLSKFVAGVARRTLLPHWLPVPGDRTFTMLGHSLRETTRELIQHHMRTNLSDDPSTDLVSQLLRTTDARTGAPMSLEEMTDEVITLIIAGIETTATCLTWACHRIARRPPLGDRLAAEASAVLAGQPAPFTDAFVNEVLRLHQPTWLLMRRALRPVEIAGVKLPADADIIFSPLTVHTDPRLFDDPMRFHPDRWLTHTERVKHRGTRGLPACAYIPFGAGNRRCIGEAFAMAEMKIVLAALNKRWRLTPAPQFRPRTVVGGVVHLDRLPLAVSLR